MYKLYREDVIAALRAINSDKVGEATDILRRAQFQNSNVYIIGNGGSAATASHFANDLVKQCGIRATALADLAPTVLAYGNDTGWDQMFAGPLKAILLPQDVLICLSCSGNSPNVVEALKMVKQLNLPGIRSIVLTGSDIHSQLAKLIPSVIVYVPFKDIRVQEDCHLIVCHTIVGALTYASAKAN